MLKFANLSNTLTRAVGNSSLTLQKHSPTILTGVGIVGVVAAGVMASRATLKLHNVTELRVDTLARIKEETSPEYTDEDRKKDVAKTYIRSGVELVRLYGPSITLGVASIGCIIAAHGIMKRRNVALAAAYKALESAFGSYRKEVAARLSEEEEESIYRGKREEIVEDENGKKATIVKGGIGNSPYARIFDSRSPRWQGNSEYDLWFLKGVETIMNDILHAKGHVFLNDVYKELGLDVTREGQIVGWQSDGSGDNYISFGVFEDYWKTEGKHVNNYDKVIYLDFNVDGPIIDLI